MYCGSCLTIIRASLGWACYIALVTNEPPVFLIYEDPFAVFLLILLFLLGLERAGQQATCNVKRTRPNTFFIDCAFVTD
jgi:hypothetical protein